MGDAARRKSRVWNQPPLVAVHGLKFTQSKTKNLEKSNTIYQMGFVIIFNTTFNYILGNLRRYSDRCLNGRHAVLLGMDIKVVQQRLWTMVTIRAKRAWLRRNMALKSHPRSRTTMYHLNVYSRPNSDPPPPTQATSLSLISTPRTW